MDARRQLGGVKAIIEIRDLRVSFDGHHVLEGLDLDVHAGESLVLIGTSGSGKTVLLRCILGLVRPDSGSIKIDGQETIGIPDYERERLMRRFGVLFQRNALFDSLTVWENVAFGLIEARHLVRDVARSVALSKLASVGLAPDVALLSSAELSGGMQKRVALARAIAADPDILLLDNPVAGLDPILTAEIGTLIVERIHALHATAVSITQDLQSIARIATRVAMLHQGRIVWAGSAAHIENSGNPYVDQLIHGRVTGPIKAVEQAGAVRS